MQAVIIAAGESSRFWPLNEKHKTLTKICGRPLIEFLIEDLRKTGLKNIVVVQGPKRDIEKELKDKKTKYAIQKNPTGTGDALLAAEKFIKDDQFFLFNAEQQNIKNRLELILKEFRKTKNELIVVGSPTRTPWIFGVLKIENGKVVEVVEKPTEGKEPSNLKIVGDYFLPKKFLSHLKKIPSHPYSLIKAISLYAKENPVGLVRIKEETLSLKYPWHLFPILEARLTGTDFKTKIARTAKIGKNVVISGRIVVSDNVRIGPNTVIQGPGYIGQDCEIGASNVLRGPFDLEGGVKTGAFMEIKHSLVGENTHFHSGYLGDSLIGPDCRFGAGLVTANRRLDRKNISTEVKGEEIDTGSTYFGAVVGNRSQFGVQVGVMPGVLVGRDCTVWPGTIVFENIPDNTTWK
ncbi:MAG: NTP transferase domain-containing protein [Candidatus Nealsonbacteria bacterium]|nr:NTP transferase domain-containing protein [Candidatus Nealsonbacteria bacterium]